MNKRERILAVVVFALAGLLAVRHFYGRYTEALQSRRVDVQTAQAKLQDVNLKLAEGRKAVQQMESWQQRSLPSNNERASSLYKAWLLEKAKDAGLAVSDIKLSPTSSNSSAYTAVAYSIVANGSLSSVTSMLYEFYHSPQLHQITRLQLTRPPGSSQLTVNLDVEALSLRGAVATDQLPQGDSKRLKLASAEAYKKSLTERDLVSAYTPPRPPTPPAERRETPKPPKFDDSEFAKFSGSLNNGKEWQAWIHIQTTGEMLHVHAGDPVKVGLLDGQIESVEARSLVLKMGDKRFRVPLGESLRKGKEINANGDAKSNPPAEPPKS